MQMGHATGSFQIGAARARIYNIGELGARIGQWFTNVPREATTAAEAATLDTEVRIPMQCVLIEVGETRVLLDASSYDTVHTSPYFIPSYSPPPSLAAQLASDGIAAESIDAVVITHLHFDHYNGTTTLLDGSRVPTFPAARHFIGSADLQSDTTQRALRESDSLQSQTLAVLLERGLVQPIEKTTEVVPGITVIPAPGESPGHQILRLESEGRTLYGLGDLVHHPLEVAHLEWAVDWADLALSTAGRQALIDAALREDALLVATHIRGAGRLRATAAGVEWVAE